MNRAAKIVVIVVCVLVAAIVAALAGMLAFGTSDPPAELASLGAPFRKRRFQRPAAGRDNPRAQRLPDRVPGLGREITVPRSGSRCHRHPRLIGA